MAHRACGAHLGHAAGRAGSTPWGKPLQRAGSQQVAWPPTTSPLRLPTPSLVSHGIRHHSLRPAVALLLCSKSPPLHLSAPRDQLSANLVARESSSWSQPWELQNSTSPSPHSQAPLGATWCGSRPPSAINIHRMKQGRACSAQ